MERRLILKLLASLGTALVMLQLANSSLAQEAGRGPDEDAENPPYRRDAHIALQWNFSCPARTPCSFTCPGAGGLGTATDVATLNVYLGTVAFPSESTVAVFFDFASRSIPRGDGFGVGMSIASCQIKGMKLDYFGPPK